MSDKFDRAILGTYQDRAGEYHDRLTEFPEIVGWLASRGIDMQAARSYELGVADGLYEGWISIPYLRRPNGTIWFNYRNIHYLRDGTPKYKAPGDKHLYNTVVLDRADQDGDVYITEGEFDAIIATEVLGLPAVGIPGATQWDHNPHWRELFVGYPSISILADPDGPGRALAEAIVASLPQARVIALPADVSDTYVQYGAERLGNLIHG